MSPTLQVFIVEDEREQAELYKAQLDLPESTAIKYSIVSSFNQVLDQYLERETIHVFLIDLNLGPGREEDGISIIKMVKKFNSFSLVLVYSANKHLKEKAIKAGADLFLRKDGVNYEKNFDNFRNHIIKYYENSSQKISSPPSSKKNHKEQNTINIPSLIEEFNEDYVELYCAFEQQKSIRFTNNRYPRSDFVDFKELYIGMPVQIVINQINNEVIVKFEEGKGKFNLEIFEPDVNWPEKSPINPPKIVKSRK